MNAKRGRVLVASVAVILGILLAVPSFIDWSGHKDVITGRIEAALGRSVTIGGRLSLSLLPVPHLSAADVRVANVEGASEPSMLRVGSLEMRLKFLPLLAGHIEVSSLALIRPELDLERLEDGSVNWRFQKREKAASDQPAEEPARVPASSSPASGQTALPIEYLAVEDGVLTFRRPGEKPLRIEAINGSFSADTINYRVSGRARVSGSNVAFDGRADRSLGQGPAGISLSLSLPDREMEARLGGTLAEDIGSFKGKLSAKAEDVGELLGAPRMRPRLPSHVEADLSLTPTEAKVQGLSFELGDQIGQGEMDFILGDKPRGDVTLSFAKIDADSLPALALGNSEKGKKNAPAAAPRSEEGSAPGNAQETGTASTPEGSGRLLDLPRNVTLNLNVGVDLITWRGRALKNARFDSQLEDGELVVNQASVTLPGDTDVNLFGFVSRNPEAPGFEGTFDGSTDDMRTLLGWLGWTPVRVPDDRLRSMRLSGNVKAGADRIVLDGLRARVDGSSAEGSLDFKPGAKPVLNATIGIDMLNLDAYWPGLGATAAAPAAASGTAGVTAPPPETRKTLVAPSTPHPSWLSGIEINVKGRVGRLVAHGATAKDVLVDAGWKDGQLSLGELAIGDLEGSEIKLSGGLGLEPLAFHDLRYDIHTPDASGLFAVAGLVSPFDLSRLGKVALTGTVNGIPAALSFDWRSEAAGCILAASGGVKNWPADPAVDIGIETSHSSLTSMVRLFAPDYRPRGTLGAFAANVRIKGDAHALALSDLRLKLGPVTAAGEATIGLGERPRVDLSLTADEIPVDQFLPSKRSAENHSLRNMIEQGLLIPSKGVPTGRLVATPAAAVVREPPAVTAAPRAQVETEDITDHWSAKPIGLGAMKAVDGSVKLEARAITWAGTRLESASLALLLSNGQAVLDHLSGQLFSGRLTSNGKLGADGAASLDAKLEHARMQDALLGLAGLDIAQGTGDATVSLRTNGLSVSEMIGQIDGTGSVSVTDGVIRGFDLKAMDSQLGSTNGALGLLGLVEAGLNGGSTRFSSLAGTFRAENGIITTNDLKLVAEGGGARARGAVNLPSYVMDARADFHLNDASGETPPLTLRVSGPLDHPRRFIDINEIQGWLSRHGIPLPVKETDKKGGKIKPKDVLKGLLQGLH